jgi:hypothetical protein
MTTPANHSVVSSASSVTCDPLADRFSILNQNGSKSEASQFPRVPFLCSIRGVSQIDASGLGGAGHSQ